MKQNKIIQDTDHCKQFSQAKSFALKFLANSAKTVSQMENFLIKNCFSSQIVEETLQYLKQNNFLNDQDFAQDWVEQRHRTKSFSTKKLQQELLNKGISEENIVFALKQITPEEEIFVAKNFIEKNLHKTKHLDHTTRVRRLVLMLAYRGYSQGLANKVVLDLIKEEKNF